MMDSLFTPFKKLKFLDGVLPFNIDPIHFMKWLKSEGEDITDDYGFDSGGMCEYACLYISMMFCNTEYKDDLKIHYGNFGFWSHYWIGYFIDGEEHFIDLTLKQFEHDAPELSITKATDAVGKGGYNPMDDDEGQSLMDYIEEKRAFMFYVNPNTMEKPPITLDSPF